jgi:hypothetical protein
MKKRIIFFVLIIILLSSLSFSLILRYDRYYNYKEVLNAIQKFKAKYPEFVKIEVIGKSYQGRDLWAVTINNPKTGKASDKPAMYVDADIHGNEIQGTEVTLYIMDYLLSNYGKIKKITKLLDRVSFYIIPIVNPDGRAVFMNKANTPSSSRLNKKPIDDDRDGLFDEDDYDDLDNDGNIVQMRKKVTPGTGYFKLSKKDPRIMESIKPGEKGDYILLGMEGIDNDGDGQINEDPLGGIDMNRSYAFNWMPPFIQWGTSDYPLQPSETAAIGRFLISHKNIAATQDFHNSGGMILRGPGASNKGRYPYMDIKVYDFIGKEGEKMLPGYEYMISWKDLYPVFGGFNDFSYRTLGILSFTNELYQAQQDFDKDGKVTREERMKWNDEILHGSGFVEWHHYKHPQYGDIEIGGWKKMTTRVTPGFQLEELCHRNGAFVIFNAYHLPYIKIKEVKKEKIGKKIYRITALIVNERMIPSRTSQAVLHNIGRPDFAYIKGKSIKVISGGIETNHQLKKYLPQKHTPNKIKISSIEGMGHKYIQWIIKGSGKISIIYSSEKGGEKSVKLKL